MRDLGELSYFFGIEVNKFDFGINLSQKKYMNDLLKKASMHKVKAFPTLMTSSTIFPRTMVFLLTIHNCIEV